MTYQAQPGAHPQTPAPQYHQAPATPPQQYPQQTHPAMRAAQGGLGNPVPIILAAVGAALLTAAAYLPAVSIDGENEMAAYLGISAQSPHPIPDSIVGLALLAITFAASVALHASSRWLQFGRLATWGVALTVVLAGFARAHAWIGNIQEFSNDRGSESEESAANTPEVTFDIGLWLFIAGVVMIALATVFIRASPPAFSAPPPQQFYPHPAPTAGQRYPQQATTPQPVQQAPQPHPPQAPPAATSGDDRNMTVQDDPPSMSIYKPPQSR